MEVLPAFGIKDKKEESMELDVKNKKIVSILGQNVRTPITKMARKVGLSKDSIRYRINILKKNEALVGTRTIIDVKRFGYHTYHLFLRLTNPSKESERELIKKLCALPYTRALLKFYGSYDFEIAVIAKNISELDFIITEILETLKGYINEYEILTIVKTLRAGAYPRSLASEINFQIEEQKKSSKEIFPDKKDIEILKTIRENADLSLVEISEKVKLSPDAVNYRLKQMYGGVILGFVPVINYQKIGYNTHVLLLNVSNLDKLKETKLERFFKSNNSTLWAVKTIGKFNILVYLCIKDISELQSAINELRTEFSNDIKSYETLLAIAEYKYTYAPDCLFK